MGTHYRSEDIVIAVAGNFDQRSLERTVSRKFGRHRWQVSNVIRKRWPPELCGGVVMKRKPLEQVHVCVGLKGIPAGHKDRYAVYVLNSVLGGSVSSRLFEEVREKRGLVYSIYSFLSGYSDSGTITVYAGTRPKEVSKVLELIRREIKRIAQSGLDETELIRTKEQMKGSLMLSLESSHSRMNKLAKDELITGCHTSLDDMLGEIDGTTEDQVFRVAQELLDLKSMAITVLGPFSARLAFSI